MWLVLLYRFHFKRNFVASSRASSGHLCNMKTTNLLTFLSIMAEPVIFVTPFFYFCRALFFYQFAVAGVVVAVLLWQLWRL